MQQCMKLSLTNSPIDFIVLIDHAHQSRKASMMPSLCPHAVGSSSLRCGRRAGQPAARLCRLLLPRETNKRRVQRRLVASCFAPLFDFEQGGNTERLFVGADAPAWFAGQQPAGCGQPVRTQQQAMFRKIQLLNNLRHNMSEKLPLADLVVIAGRPHPFPFLTRP